MHLVVYGNGQWHCSEFADGAEKIYASNTISRHPFSDVRDGKPHVINLKVTKAGAATLTLPDGSTATFRNSAIASDVSHYAVLELFENNARETDQPATIQKFWAA